MTQQTEKDRILSAAMQLANLAGFAGVTRDGVANKANCACGSVTYYFGNVKKLRAAMVERAIETENLAVLGQAVAAEHPLAMAAPEALRRRAVLAMV